MQRTIAAFLAVVGGCFEPTLPDPLLCSRDRPFCPTSYECDYDRGCCRPAGGSCGTDSVPPPDLLAVPDLAEPSECTAGGGIRLATGVWACLGKFGRGQAATLCKHRLGDASLPKAVVDECNRHLGFWLIPDQLFAVSNKLGTCLAPETQTCTWSPGVTLSYRLGCGGYKCSLYRDCATSCGAWGQALSCFAAYPNYLCQDATKNQFNDINSDSNIGVICQR